MFLLNYTSLFIYLLLIAVVAFAIFALSFFLFFQVIDNEKNSIYECGFTAFSDARHKIDIKFYLVSILFIVLDLEIAFLLPAITTFSRLDFIGIAFIYGFLSFLVLSFVYEWRLGSMDW